jgi:hypothetical protein
VNHREVFFLGDVTTEAWFNTDAVDFPFARNQSASIEIGCVATHSARKIDSSVIWVGADTNGMGIVYRLAGYTPQRISTIAVEEALQASTDISKAVAWVYQKRGQSFWCVNAPGLTSTWCYEIATGAWHERCDLDPDGEFIPFRVTCHAFAYGWHLVGDAHGNIYYLDDNANLYGDGKLKRSRISPNNVTPYRDRQFFTEGFVLDCVTGLPPQGASPTVELSWSDNGGFYWGNPVQRSAGVVGNYLSRIIWHSVNGPEARDRIWRVDFSENAPFSIIHAEAR